MIEKRGLLYFCTCAQDKDNNYLNAISPYCVISTKEDQEHLSLRRRERQQKVLRLLKILKVKLSLGTISISFQVRWIF